MGETTGAIRDDLVRKTALELFGRFNQAFRSKCDAMYVSRVEIEDAMNLGLLECADVLVTEGIRPDEYIDVVFQGTDYYSSPAFNHTFKFSTGVPQNIKPHCFRNIWELYHGQYRVISYRVYGV